VKPGCAFLLDEQTNGASRARSRGGLAVRETSQSRYRVPSIFRGATRRSPSTVSSAISLPSLMIAIRSAIRCTSSSSFRGSRPEVGSAAGEPADELTAGQPRIQREIAG